MAVTGQKITTAQTEFEKKCEPFMKTHRLHTRMIQPGCPLCQAAAYERVFGKPFVPKGA